jgi:hypothetical protein
MHAKMTIEPAMERMNLVNGPWTVLVAAAHANSESGAGYPTKSFRAIDSFCKRSDSHRIVLR